LGRAYIGGNGSAAWRSLQASSKSFVGSGDDDPRQPMSVFWGCGDLDGFFKGAPKVIVPWPSAGRFKTEPRIPVDEVRRLLAGPARLHEVDPRALFATQTWVLRGHAAYYLTGEWEVSGRTSADMHSFANRYPTFVERRGQLLIATGHHRSLAAMIVGRPVLARVVAAGTQPVSITPHLTISDSGGEFVEDVDVLADRLVAGQRITVSSESIAVGVLRRVGLNEQAVSDRMANAGFRDVTTSLMEAGDDDESS
jgi:hypothetical protein